MTKEELLFLHLLDNSHQKDKFIVDELITESGICQILECDRSYVSRLLKKNEEDGMIMRNTRRIKNKVRKQRAFFLTEQGLRTAKEIENENNSDNE